MDQTVTRERVLDGVDICVVGGGLAGVCAALAAARLGVATALVTDRPVLGGNSSSELRIPPAGTGYYNPWATETGIIHELITEDRARNHDPVQYGHANGVWDFVLYDACRREPHLTLLLNTLVDQVHLADGQTITAVSGPQSGSGTRWRVPARSFIDASGDGVVGVGAGVPWRRGAEARSEYGESFAPESPDDFQMGSTLTFRARDLGVDAPYTPPDWAHVYDYPDGIPHRSTSSFAGGYWWIEIGWPLDTLFDNDAIRDELLRHVYGIWDHIKNRGRERERARTWVLDWVGVLPARRESRRFVGAHVLTEAEVTGRVAFDDVVAYGGWCIDDHTRGGILALDQEPSFDGVRIIDYFQRPYGVPLRSLFADEVTNLWFAGRVMSASRVVFSSLRVQQTLAVIGQAAGTAAALGVRDGLRPAELAARPAAMQQQLLRDDAWLPGVRSDDLAVGAAATASSVAPLLTAPGQGGIPLDRRPAALLPTGGERPAQVTVYLSNTAGPSEVRLSVHAAHHVWDLEALAAPPLVTASVTAPAGEGWATIDLPDVAGDHRLLWVRLTGPTTVSWRYAADDPIGTVCAYERPDGTLWFAPGTWSRWHALTAHWLPAARPYTADQVCDGHSRPGTDVSAWVSDPAAALPQWLELGFTARGGCTFDTVQVLFDTQLNRINYVTPGLFRAPECVRDYTISAEVGGQWRELVAVTGNYRRRREHPVGLLTATRVRVTVTATNGDAAARIYAVRLYKG